MTKPFEVKVSKTGIYHLERGVEMLELAEHSSQLRRPETQAEYENYMAEGGVGIKIGLQENIFPYNLILSEMYDISKLNWSHFVYASLGMMAMTDLIDVAESVIKSNEYIAFINPVSKQTQCLPHGHLIVKR